jgi:hypothetical protein
VVLNLAIGCKQRKRRLLALAALLTHNLDSIREEFGGLKPPLELFYKTLKVILDKKKNDLLMA